jgi:hypothetical protein
MNIRKSLICALLVVSLPAVAEFTTISRAYEIALSDFRVPATPSSGAMFKECAECDMMSVRVTPKTQYVVNGKSITLKAFRKAVFQIHDRAAETIIVLHHLESDTIVSISVTI